MTTAHAVIGIATVASLLALVLWAIGAKIVKRTPGPSYERVARVPIAWSAFIAARLLARALMTGYRTR